MQRAEKGGRAIGRSRGGRTTKTHALTDAFCRPIACLLAGGQVVDCTLLDAMSTTGILHGDKGYDSNAVRTKMRRHGRGTEYSAQGQTDLEEQLIPGSWLGRSRLQTG